VTDLLLTCGHARVHPEQRFCHTCGKEHGLGYIELDIKTGKLSFVDPIDAKPDPNSDLNVGYQAGQVDGKRHLLAEINRLRKAELEAAKFIQSVMNHRAECHAYDLDMGNPRRVFSDSEEWDRLEDQAAEFLTKRAVS
jgi:hypothetical protein